MSLLVVGLSHRSAPVSVLERASLNEDDRIKLLQDTVAAEPATEAAVLATCNRIELYADVDKFHAGVAELSTLLAQHSGVGLEELTPYLYVHYEDRAVHHLFSVACGLDSMVVGEGQILGQIKDSLARAQELHTAGRLLNDLFQQGLRVGKRAHSETGIDRAGQSLVTFGLEQLSQGADVQEWAHGKKALVIGAGSMSSLAAATLARAGVGEIVIANRTAERAERLAQILTEGDDTHVLARAVPMDAVPAELTRADIAVSCTGATGLVLTAETIAAALEGRTGAPAAVTEPAAEAGEDGRAQAGAQAGPQAKAARGDVRETPLPPAAGEDGCPLDLATVESGFSLLGESAVAGIDAATLEQHGTWVDNGRLRGPPGHGRARGRGRRGTDHRARRDRRHRRPHPRAPQARAGSRRAAPRAGPVRPRPGHAAGRGRGRAPAGRGAPGGHRVAGRGVRGRADGTPTWTRSAGSSRRGRRFRRGPCGGGTIMPHRGRPCPPWTCRTSVSSEIRRLEVGLAGLDDSNVAEITQTVRRVGEKCLHAPTGPGQAARGRARRRRLRGRAAHPVRPGPGDGGLRLPARRRRRRRRPHRRLRPERQEPRASM
ncbi:LOW QUALITY PROTEIN: glutamyl-tRNA reductase, partial [Streptomyces sp. e14]